MLKPPGGGSSDIFGSDSADGPVPRRVVRSQDASLGNVIQQVNEPLSATPSKPRVDSHSRLFGPPAEAQVIPSKNRMKSNIPIGEAAGAAAAPAVNGHAENGHVNGDTTGNQPTTTS